MSGGTSSPLGRGRSSRAGQVGKCKSMEKKGPPFNGHTSHQAQAHQAPQFDLALQPSNGHQARHPLPILGPLRRDDQGQAVVRKPQKAFVTTSKQAPTLSFYPNRFKEKAASPAGNVLRSLRSLCCSAGPRDVPSIVLDGAPARAAPCRVRCLARWPLRGQPVVLVIELAERGSVA